MIRNGIEGPETCAEVFEPHYTGFHLNAANRLESAIKTGDDIDEVGQALAGYYRMSDIAGPYLQFRNAPEEVQDLALCMRDAAMALIRQAGGSPDDFNTPPALPVSASSRY